jgi:putative endopeptidase
LRVIEQQKEFFIGFAKTLCSVIPSKDREYFVKRDKVHAPPDLRVNNQMKLSKQFEETFSCKQGDAMTISDSERIALW